MNISRIGIFCEAIRFRSFTKAAELCGYSQSAVSQNIKALERELGFTLVDRRSDGVGLTKDGEAFYPYLKSVYAAEKELEQKREEMEGLESGVIRIGTFTSVSRNFLIGPMTDFKKKYPDVTFILRQGDHTSIPEWIREGSVDLGFINTDLVNDLGCVPLYRDDFMAVFPKGHRLAEKSEVSLEELLGERMILLDEGEPDIALQAFENAGLTPRPDYVVYDDYTVIEMVRKGLGVSMMYAHFLPPFSGDVEVKPIAEHPGRTIALAWRNAKTLPYAASLFAKELLEDESFELAAGTEI